MIPQQKGAPRSSGHHLAGVTPHDKDGSPQGFHLPEKGQGTRKKGLGGGELGVRPSRPVTPLPLGLAPCSSSADVPMAAASSRAAGLGCARRKAAAASSALPGGSSGCSGPGSRVGV